MRTDDKSGGKMMTNSNLIIIQGGFIILCLGGIFMHSSLFTDPYIVFKWLFIISILLGMVMCSSIRNLLGRSMRMDMSLIGISIVIVCGLQALYGLSQYIRLFSSNYVSEITGSFDNLAGFVATLSIGFSFVVFFIRKGSRKYVQCLGWIAAIIFLIVVILSGSRAGIVSVMVISFIFLYSRFIQKRILKYLLLSDGVLILVGCYWMKKDSADGRLLLWQCGINMVKNYPWIGYGISSFEVHYMDYQAEYFETDVPIPFLILLI